MHLTNVPSRQRKFSVKNLPSRQKSFVLGAATVAAAAGAAGPANAQFSVSYNAGSIANLSTSGKGGLYNKNITSVVASGSWNTSNSEAVNLAAFNPANFSVAGQLAELTGVTLSLGGSAYFNASSTWSVSVNTGYAISMSLGAANATLMLTIPTSFTLSAAAAGGLTGKTGVSGIGGSSNGHMNIGNTAAQAMGNSLVLTNASFGVGNGFNSPTNPFYGGGNVSALSLVNAFTANGYLWAGVLGSVYQSWDATTSYGTNITANILYTYTYVPGPGSMAVFAPGALGLLGLARRRRAIRKKA
jgi:hypothetical protein